MEAKLIEFVRQHEFLYNKQLRNHKNFHLRNQAFAELSKKINIPARKLKDRWRTLRDRFLKEMKIVDSPSRPRKKWKWLDHLMFLKNGNIPCQEIEENVSIFSQQTTRSESPEPVSPRIETSAQNTFSDDILDIMEDILGDVDNGISQVVKMAKDVLAAHTERKTAAQLFFEGIATQTDDAKLSPTEFTHLQMEMLSTFNKFFIERQDIKVEAKWP